MMANINTELYDSVIDHNINLRSAEAGVQKDIKDVIKEHKRRLKLQLDKDIRSDVKPEVERFIKAAYNRNITALSDLSKAEADFQVGMMHKEVKNWYSVKKPSNQALKEIVGGNIVDGRSTLDLYNSLGNRHLLTIKKKIKKGISESQTNPEIISSVMKMGLTEAQASTIVRTSITHVQNASAYSMYEQNADILDGYRFVATLDSRTSRICSHNDGLVWPLEDKSHIPPLHFRCRSTTTPVVKAASELKQPIPESEKERLDGKPPIVEDFGGWLRRQTMAVKLKHLGDQARVDLFEAGKIQIKQFTDKAGKAISMLQLRKLDIESTSGVGLRNIRNKADDIIASTPNQLYQREARKQLKKLLIADANDGKSVLNATDFRGALLSTKNSSRYKASNDFDNSGVFFDALTGQAKSKYVYDPDPGLLSDRLNYVRQSAQLTPAQKKFIAEMVDDLGDSMSVNQQTVVAENLRLVFERYNRTITTKGLDEARWENLPAVLRAEMKNSVTNVSKRLETRTRQDSQTFGRFGNDDRAEVQILGKFESFDDISSNLRKNRMMIEDWELNVAPKITRSVLRDLGSAPLRRFFLEPSTPAPPKQSIMEILRKKLKLDTLEKVDKWILEQKESLRGLFTLERSIEAERDLFEKYIATKLPFEDQVKLFSNATKLVAAGESTDYDALAIAIGKAFREKYKPPYQGFFSPTLEDYRKDGVMFLDALVRAKKIRVLNRGIQRRGVVDLDTGRPAGAFFNVNARQVEVIDPDMLEYQRNLRRVVVGERIGYIDKTQRYHVVKGEKTYRDAFGNKTDRSIITRGASSRFDEKIIDKDFVDMLNHSMSFEFEVDPDFSDFMLRVVNFRDVRGEAEKWDSLNGFRKIVLERGEQGFGLIQTIKWHLQHRKPFTAATQIDSRGRVYYTGYLTPGGGEVVRPFLNTAKAKPLGQKGFEELMIQTGAMVGKGADVLSNSGRIKAFKDNHQALIDLGKTMLSPTQKDRRVKDFLSHPLIVDQEPEEVAKLARLAMEVARVDVHLNGDYGAANLGKLNSFKTRLAVENDASSSGAQIIALSTKNKALAEISNVVPTTSKRRLYDIIAMRTISDPRWEAIREKGVDITWEQLAKAAKAQNMVAFYGAGKATQIANIEAKLASILGKNDGLLVINKAELSKVNRLIDGRIKFSEANDSLETARRLRLFKKELEAVVKNERSYDSALMREASDLHEDVALFISRLSNTHQKIIGPDVFREISTIMSEYLAKEAPITQTFIEFWKDAARTFVQETKSAEIPWVTFDGKLLKQNYQVKVEQKIAYKDARTGRYIENIVQIKPEDDVVLGKISEIEARSGLGVNGNHSNDATIVRKFHLWGKKAGVDTATIHDAFFTNIADAPTANNQLRLIYGDAAESDSIRDTLKAMKSYGLSSESYRRLLKKAEEGDLLGNTLSRKDIVRELLPDEAYYGIGP